MTRRPIDPRIEPTGAEGPREGLDASPEAFKEALSHWASGVAVVAVRDPDDGRVHATTVGSFGGVSAEPPRVVLSLGPGAQVLPFLEEDGRFIVNLLSSGQRRLASLFTDAFPVGPSPFPPEGDPAIAGSLVSLACRVEHIVPVDRSRLVVGRVVSTEPGSGGPPLLYFRRQYRPLDEDR